MTGWQKFIVVLVLIFGLILRLHNYDKYPQRGATSDEFTYSFLGVSLLTKHIPISWSHFAYKNKEIITIRGILFPIVYPYFDHPPLNGLLVGGWAIVNGQSTFESIQIRTIRLIPIALSMFSSFLVFLIGRKLFDYKTALWALVIYSIVTTFVMNGRMVLAENLLTPILLGSVYLFMLWNKKMTPGRMVTLGILSGLAFWTKELGIAVGLTIGYLLIEQKIKIKQFWTFYITVTLFILLYIAYGMYFGSDQFWSIVLTQSARDIGPKTLQYILTNPIIVNKPYADGWYFLGFMALFISFINYQKLKLIIVPFLIYFLLLLFTLTQNQEIGWYMIPLFPFMSLAIAHLWKKQAWFIFLPLLFVGFYLLQYLFLPFFGLTSGQFRIFLIILFGPVIMAQSFGREDWLKSLSSAWFNIFVICTAYLTYTYIHPA